VSAESAIWRRRWTEQKFIKAQKRQKKKDERYFILSQRSYKETDEVGSLPDDRQVRVEKSRVVNNSKLKTPNPRLQI
jgi:hypothetical protein